VQDDLKLSGRFTLNLGLRWEFIGASTDELGRMGNASAELMRSVAIPPAAGTLVGNTVAANYNPELVNPYTGKAFGVVPAGVVVRPNSSLYDNGTPKDRFAPRVGFAWQPFGSTGRLVVGGGYGRFYQTPVFSGNAGSAPLFTAPPFAQSFTNTDSSNNLSTFEKPFPVTTLGYVPRTLTSQLSDRVGGPVYRIPRLQQWNLSTKWKLTQVLALDVGYVGSKGSELLYAHGLNQPLLASAGKPVNWGYDGVAGHCITTNTSKNAKQRVLVMGETPTALLASEFGADSWYQSMQATLRGRVGKALTFQAAYTYSKALINGMNFNDQLSTLEARGRASFDRPQRLIANFDYQLPWRGGAMCPGATYGDLMTAGGVSERLSHWVNTAAICAAPVVGVDGATGYGNAGQSLMNGPGQVNTDFSVGKRTRVGGMREDAELAFRVEFYNALNHAQFANPGTTLGTASFGVVTQTPVAPRLIQFGLKYLF
jgi:hypothetical protein